MTWGAAASRYWEEIGQHTRSADRTLVALEWLTRHLGEATPLAAVTSDKIARLVAKRRADGIAPATVNRSMTEPLRRVLTRARLVWGVALPPIEWRRHLLAEPQERIRELRADEEATFFAALRPDYHSVARFALLTGCRLAECVGLTWADVDWGGRLIWINGKGGKRASIPMPPSVRELLWPLQGQHSGAVFTYLAAGGGAVIRPNAERRPITYDGLGQQTYRTIKRAGIADFSFHDLRHTAATRALRATGNLNVVKRMLRHTNIRMTAKYAHSQHDDVLAGMVAAATSAECRHGVPTQRPHSETFSKAKADA
jgi:integrase